MIMKAMESASISAIANDGEIRMGEPTGLTDEVVRLFPQSVNARWVGPLISDRLDGRLARLPCFSEGLSLAKVGSGQ